MKPIIGQVQYLGPHLPQVIGYGTIFKNGIYPHLYNVIAQCPALGEMFVPIHMVGPVLRELSFDYAHQMRGVNGRYVTFYREVQQWIASQNKKKKKPTPTGVTTEEKPNAQSRTFPTRRQLV